MHEPVNYGTFIGEIFKDNIINVENNKIKYIKETNQDNIIINKLYNDNNNEINKNNSINLTKNNNDNNTMKIFITDKDNSIINENKIIENNNNIQNVLNSFIDDEKMKTIHFNDDKKENNNFNNNRDNINVDMIIRKLISVRSYKPGKLVDVLENEIKYILDITRNRNPNSSCWHFKWSIL